MKWDPTGERVVVSFKSQKTVPTQEEDITYEDSGLLCVFSSKITSSNIVLAPIGFIRGDPEESPITFEFAKHFKLGALLTIVSIIIIELLSYDFLCFVLENPSISTTSTIIHFRHGQVDEYSICQCFFRQRRQCQLELA